jgi:hypothetical protein
MTQITLNWLTKFDFVGTHFCVSFVPASDATASQIDLICPDGGQISNLAQIRRLA